MRWIAVLELKRTLRSLNSSGFGPAGLDILQTGHRRSDVEWDRYVKRFSAGGFRDVSEAPCVAQALHAFVKVGML